MLTRRACCKIVAWSGFAILLMLAAYCGTYHRMVIVINSVDITGDGTFHVMRSPGYRLPWPFLTPINQPEVRRRLEALYGPAHELDRLIRPAMWETREVQAGLRLDSLPNP